jgi:hypothetical protein
MYRKGNPSAESSRFYSYYRGSATSPSWIRKCKRNIQLTLPTNYQQLPTTTNKMLHPFKNSKAPCILIRIPEQLVLLVSHGGPHLRRQVSFLRLCSIATSLVSPDIVQKQSEGCQSTACLRAHDSKLGWSEIRRILGLECLRPNDVANGKGATDDGSSKGSLCGTTEVCSSPLSIDCVG